VVLHGRSAERHHLVEEALCIAQGAVALRAIIRTDSSSMTIFSSAAIARRFFVISAMAIRRKSKRWQRERMVAGTL